MFRLESIKKNRLSYKEVVSICKLKNSFWNFGIKSNLLWFKNNVKNNDLNIILKSDRSTIGYTLLRKRTYLYLNKKRYFFYLDTIIIAKKSRGQKFGKALILFNNFIIEKFDLLGFLLCKKKDIKFYKKFGWKLLNSKKYTIQNKDQNNLHGMSYNSNENNFKKFFV